METVVHTPTARSFLRSSGSLRRPFSHTSFLEEELEKAFKEKPEGFFKFFEPCSHLLYQRGKSWREETAWPRKKFVKAFDLIGVRYKSKSAFLKAKDPFQGKAYASYYNRKTNCTFFYKNPALKNTK